MLWGLVVSIIICIFVMVPQSFFRCGTHMCDGEWVLIKKVINNGWGKGRHIVIRYICVCRLLCVSLLWCLIVSFTPKYKAGWSLLSQLVPPTNTNIRIKKLPYKLCVKKDCCIFVLMLWCGVPRRV